MSGPLQWTPNGMVAVGGQVVIPASRGPIAEPEDDDDSEPENPTNLPRRPTKAFAAVKPAKKPLAPKNIVQAAKARLREVKAELRRMKRLEEERDELERLVDAAENKPRAVVRELPKRSAG